ncbi:MAG TPA: energy-coupling factor ABC transporter permease, partial [Nitrospirota bacterium]|nr:energy-coupling factor ABC transporter permease [Nitrospirota bacterium]
MTLMHMPDDVLSVWIRVLGFILMSLVMGFSLFWLRNMDMKKKIPLLGLLSATMLMGMSLPPELILSGYHINLPVVTGILAGAALGFLAAFIANPMLAFRGQGGISAIDFNRLLRGSETIYGHSLFYLHKRLPAFWRAALATVGTLLVTTMVLTGFVALLPLTSDLLYHRYRYGYELKANS